MEQYGGDGGGMMMAKPKGDCQGRWQRRNDGGWRMQLALPLLMPPPIAGAATASSSHFVAALQWARLWYTIAGGQATPSRQGYWGPSVNHSTQICNP